MLGIFKSIKTTIATALRKPVTVEYPDQKKKLPARSRGLPLLVWDHEHDEPFCIGCKQCAKDCPVDCITVAGPVENPRYPPKDHDEDACKTENNGTCIHTSPRRTLPAESLADSMRFIIDEDRCMRCGICEEVCPTDQDRYGNKKAIVLGTGNLAIQSSVYDRSDNVLDLDGLTHHSRVLKLELNEVMSSTKKLKDDLDVNSPEASGVRLSGGDPIYTPKKSRLKIRFKVFFLKLYAPLWLLRNRRSKSNEVPK